MRRLRFSPVALASGTVGALLVAYIALVAVVMSYASLTIEYSQSVKRDESALSILESQYLATVAQTTSANYSALGYAQPTSTSYVPARSVTALR